MSSIRWKYPPTENQLETLNLMFRGYTQREVAEIRHKHPTSVEYDIRALKEKSGKPDANLRELIFDALGRGWLKPPQVVDNNIKALRTRALDPNSDLRELIFDALNGGWLKPPGVRDQS